MFLRKLRSVALMADKHKHHFKYKEAQFFTPPNKNSLKYALYIFLFFCIWFLLLFFWFPNTQRISVSQVTTSRFDIDRKVTAREGCDGRVWVYMYELPEKFNLGLLRECRHLNVYTDMCPHVANRGLGQPLEQMGKNWFATHQFIAEMIFHARVENHPCRTWEPENATVFYVPFYGGLYASSQFREPDLAVRDRLATELVEYLGAQAWWKRHGGRDHFLALGRTAWDFMRTTISQVSPDFGANSLLNSLPVKNMSVLTVERHPWHGLNQHGIPYPSYFHPSTLPEMLTWQDKMRHISRPYLFSFVGAPRKGVGKAAIRDVILSQCTESSRCKLLKCENGASKCHNPEEVLKVMMSSQFCMQAPGDSFTRRSTFDSVLAGCIPVFFSPHTAYTQYEWYLPEEKTDYSVYIEEKESSKSRIEEELVKISGEEVEKMRSKVIDLIPKLTYMHPNASFNAGFRDAVDVALAQVSNHVLSTLLQVA